MITINHDMDSTDIVVLDPEGSYEDVIVHMFDDIVYIKQYDEDTDRPNIITMSPIQYLLFMKSYELPEGAYQYYKDKK